MRRTLRRTMPIRVFLGLSIMFLLCTLPFAVRATTQPNRYVVLTFDDAQAGIYDNGVPALLDTYGWTAGLFIPSNLVGGTFETHELMNWTQIQELVDDYNWEVYSHGYNHIHWNNTRSATEVYDEVTQSMLDIEGNLSESVAGIQSPYAEGYGNTTWTDAIAANYSWARGSNNGFDGNTSALLGYWWASNVSLLTMGGTLHTYISGVDVGGTSKLNATGLASNTTEFVRQTIECWVADNDSAGSVLNLAFHEITNASDYRAYPYGDITIGNFTAVCSYLNATETAGDIEITTLNSVLAPRLATESVYAIIPAILAIGMLGMALGMVKKMRN